MNTSESALKLTTEVLMSNTTTKKPCSINGCKRKHFGNGWCSLHWQRLKITGLEPGLVALALGVVPTHSASYKHGFGGKLTRRRSIYGIWSGIIQRCTNPNATHYANYGGRGIQVCERWRSFENFLEDMGERPDKTYSIDRINNNGNYEPENCRWATGIQQQYNRTKIYSTNTSGTPGVAFGKKDKQWIAYFTVGDFKRRKQFKTKEEAIAKRKEWEQSFNDSMEEVE